MKEQLAELADKYERYKNKIFTEEATKQVLVLPFIEVLGYDTRNPCEVIPEFIADMGIKKGEKVDYAIIRDDTPILLIEVKQCSEVLNNNNISQLFRYYSATKAKIAVLTNGHEYRFFSDIDQNNLMDNEPFFIFRVNRFDHDDVGILEHFTKDAFNADNICSFAEKLKYRGKIKEYFSKQCLNPSEEFTFFIAQKACGVDDAAKIREIIKEVLPKIVCHSEVVEHTDEDTIKVTLNDDPKTVKYHFLISYTFDGKTYEQAYYIQMLIDVIKLLNKNKPGVLETLVAS